MSFQGRKIISSIAPASCNLYLKLETSPGWQLTLIQWVQGQKWPVTITAALPTTTPLHLSSSVNSHPGEVSNIKRLLVGRCKGIHRYCRKARQASKSGTFGSIWRGNDEAFFELILHKGRPGGILLSLELKKNCSGLEFRQIDLSYEGSYSGYAIEPKIYWNNKSNTKNTVEYIKGKSFFIHFLEQSLDLKFFYLHRSQYFISHQGCR